MIEIFGWLGTVCYTLYSLPQMISVVRAGNARALGWGFLLLLWFGALFSFIYVLSADDMPLMVNFGINLVSTSIMLRYKIFER